jgi:DNA-binding protein Fis
MEAPSMEYLLILDSLDLRAGEQRMIEHALALTNGNRTKAAKLLGINLRTLRRKLNGTKKSTPRDDRQLSLV